MDKKEEPQVSFGSITLAEFIDDYGWDFFVSRQYTEEALKEEIREQLLASMRFYYVGILTYEFMLRYEEFSVFAEACEKYKKRQMTKPEFLAVKDAYLAEVSEKVYQRRLHRDPFCMKLRFEMGIPDPYMR